MKVDINNYQIFGLTFEKTSYIKIFKYLIIIINKINDFFVLQPYTFGVNFNFNNKSLINY